MQTVSIYKIGTKVTFRPVVDTPTAVVAVGDHVTIDPAKDLAYVGPIGNPTAEFRPSGMLIAARAGMFGFALRSDASRRLAVTLTPEAPAPAVKARKPRTKKDQSDLI